MKHLILLLLFIPLLSIAQFKAYYPDGRKITSPFKTIDDLKNQLGVGETEVYLKKDYVIHFKKFTKTPAFIIFFKNPKPEAIKSIISSYAPEYRSYLCSYSYYADLRDMIREGKLTPTFIKETFGLPSATTTEDNGDSTNIFRNFNCSLTYRNDSLVNFDVFSYNDVFYKHKLLIIDYDVTGDDYSMGFSISFSNFDNRTIKYIYTTATATNAVDDLVGKKTFTGVGPIKPNEGGSYEYENAFYSKTAQYLNLNSIKVLYTDGTQRIIPQSEIKYIKKVDWEELGKRTID